ncbi:MAG: hypothetical protein COB59_00355 [Rhodospirillaceae bacterium]|nr:MAG: hypothetical protein COB59_00355 [Rhodospirillaceae bacterium]
MNEHPPTLPAQNKRRWLRVLVLALIYGGLLAGGHWGSQWLIDIVGVDISADTKSHARHIVMAAVVFYTALMAMPFVPGIEISLALFAAFGPDVAIVLYMATVVALTISYLIGRLLPVHLIAKLFAALGLHRAEVLMLRLMPMNRQQRLEALISQAPKRIVPTLLKHRYIAVIVMLNAPGNAIIGGGGGIAMLAGLSGLFTFPRYFAILLLAVMPVPLAILLMGS